jgi:beta-N-acetylhexosaminidase
LTRGTWFGRPAPARLLTILLSIAVIGAAQPALAASRPVPATAPNTQNALAAVSLRALIGQKLVVAMRGTSPSDELLGRIRRGEVGGVILFAANIRSAPQLVRLTAALRRAARDGGQPPLLITTDQEGGGVRRVPWAPPTLSPPQMGAIGRTGTAFAQGRTTGHVLRCGGINSNLAPVADVPASASSILYRQGRTWSFSAAITASLSDAFASGLEAGADVPAMKHFPGLGRARNNTDTEVVSIRASKSALGADLRPYRTAIGHDIPMVMLANATYTAYDRSRAAGWSHAISVGLLREQLGFRGVSITDSLTGTAQARGVRAASLAIKAAIAGTDMILLTGKESGSSATYGSLLSAARDGRIPLSRLRASYQRILAMKDAFPTRVTDTNPPRVDEPVSSLQAGTRLGSSGPWVRTAWSGRDKCAVAGYGLQRRTESGAWISVSLAGSRSTRIVQSLRFGTRYRYRVAGTDGAGNRSASLAGPLFRPRRAEETDSQVTLRGSWKRVANASASGGALATSTRKGDRAALSFTGYSVSWVAVRGPSRGYAGVWIDGHYVGRLNLHAASRQARQVVFARAFADGGTHRIAVENLGTAGHSRVDLDVWTYLEPMTPS